MNSKVTSIAPNKQSTDVMTESECRSLKHTRYFTITANTLIHVVICACTSWYPVEVAHLIFAEGLILLPAAWFSTTKKDFFNPAVIFIGGVSGATLACNGFSLLKIAEYISLLATTVVAMLAKTTITTNVWLCFFNVASWSAYWLTHRHFICDEIEFTDGCQKQCKTIPEITLFFCSIVIAIMNSIGLIKYRNNMITELRAANKNLEASLSVQAELNVELQRLLEVRESFILKFSHELRNPLNSIIGNIELTLLEKLPPGIAEQIMNAKVSGEQLLQIINNILDSGKLEVSSLDINPVRCRIDTYLESFWMIASSLIKSKGLYGELVIDSHFPKYIQIDQLRVTQILMNLVGNAIKFTNNGRVIIKLSFIQRDTLDEINFKSETIGDQCDGLSEKKLLTEPVVSSGVIKRPGKTYANIFGPAYKLTPKKKAFNQEVFLQTKKDIKGFLRIEVIDTGCGMVEEQVSRVFEKFSQFHSEATRRKIGTGLGLWITKELCNMMGGDVRVKSLPQVGTSFIACIQSTADSAVELPLASTKDFTTCSRISFSNLCMRVIVADDIEYNRDVNRKMLNKTGVEEVYMASNGKEVVQLYKKHPRNHFSAILMDLDMPEMDGMEACTAIRSYEKENGIRNVPIVIVTGHASEQMKKACLDPNGKGLKFDILPSNFPEDLDKSKYPDPKDYVKDTCFGKLKDVKEQLIEKKIPYDLVICCDTVVLFEGKIIEKPEDEKSAYDMIKGFSGKTHEVLSVLYLLFRHEDDVGETLLTGTEISKVTFGEIPEKSIEIYSKIEDIRKVSGGYRVQDMGLSFMSAIEGCFGNIVGLPVHLFCKLVIEGIDKAGWAKKDSK